VAVRLCHPKDSASKLLAVILVAVLSLQLGSIMIRTLYEIRQSNTGGIASFSTKKWVNSETIQYIRRNSANTLILSNEVYPIYIYTDGKGTYLYIHAKQDKLQQQLENIKDSEGYLVFFHDWASHLFNYDASELRGLLGPAVAELSDGVIFKVNKSPVINANFYRSTYETQLQEDPIIRSVFDVYHKGRELTYVKEPCCGVEATQRFFLHIIPADMNNLPDDRKQYGFDNFDLDFGRYGARFDEKVCLVTISLPDYDIAYIRTGQFTSGKSGTIWKQGFRFDSNSSR